jgi:Ran-binding protein 3
VVTGEEDEELLYSVRGKLYVMEDGQWRERGTGQLRVNSKFGGNAPRLGASSAPVEVCETSLSMARPVMRAEATHRLLLNAALFAGFTIKSSDRMVSFATFNEGKLASYALRVRPTPVLVEPTVGP